MSATLYKGEGSFRDVTSVQRLWVGYGTGGGRATLDVGGPGSRVLLLGSRARDLASLAAISSREAGLAPLIFDLDGALAGTLSGYFDTFDYRSFLYDSFRLEEPGAWHSQLAAAAYTAALDLSSEEEAIINAAMQQVASDGTLLSPVSLYDVMGKVEGFRGFYVDKLSGRIGSLRLFDAVEDQTFDRLVQGNVIVDLHRAPYPQAAELSAALFIAKMLAIAHSRGGEGLLLLTDAHRVFRASPRPMHANRLLTTLLGLHGTTIVATDQAGSLSPLLLDSCPIRICSSEVWHSSHLRTERVLPGGFVLQDSRTGRAVPFIPRLVQSKTSDYASARPSRYPSPELTRLALDAVDRFPLATPESVVRYIAPEFLPSDISSVLSGLESRGCIILEPKDSAPGPRVFAYTLTEKGRSLLEELRG